MFTRQEILSKIMAAVEQEVLGSIPTRGNCLPEFIARKRLLPTLLILYNYGKKLIEVTQTIRSLLELIN